MTVPPIHLSDYQYLLPEEKIAKFPLEKRDASKLLHFESGIISHHRFLELPDLLPANTLMIFNNTKVIPARLIFQRNTGAKIEIFLLKPLLPSPVITEVMAASGSVTWETMIGNLKKWKEGEILQGKVEMEGEEFVLEAILENGEQIKVDLRLVEEKTLSAFVERCEE